MENQITTTLQTDARINLLAVFEDTASNLYQPLLYSMSNKLILYHPTADGQPDR
ncbi:hypothetical protein ACRQ5D_29255 [Mucilaginibacter sp. P25]|uniref:hypothetical protein n=1 Tax=unclassified Mucilaginibacter TaxID=2617802 RepID=UPI003D66B5F8